MRQREEEQRKGRMWEILKSWRTPESSGKSKEGDNLSPAEDRRNLRVQSVNFKDLNITAEPSDDELEEGTEAAHQAGASSVPTSTGAAPPGRSTSLPLRASRHRSERSQLVIIMVGLPGRGKTFLCNKLVCYLSWLGHTTKLFNVGSYRRLQRGEHEVQDAAFFGRDNEKGRETRQRALYAALEDLQDYLAAEGQVAIFDATNTTEERRRLLVQRFHGKYQYIFIESICTDQSVLEANYRFKMRYSPDYVNMDEDKAVEDFRQRIKNYEEVYEPITDRNLHYIKLIDMVTGRAHLDINRISGYIPGKIVFFLMQVCKAGMTQKRKIWLTRHGESIYNTQGLIGGDSSLSEKGWDFARALPEALLHRIPMTPDAPAVPVSVWTSTLKRTIESASHLPFPKLRWKALDEIHAGSYDGCTYAQIANTSPEEYEARQMDKLRYRYPAGESYLDVIQRLEPVIIELEREKESVCIVGHQAVLRALYGYFAAVPLQDIPTLEVPLHHLIELQPKADGTMQVERIPVQLDSLSSGLSLSQKNIARRLDPVQLPFGASHASSDALESPGHDPLPPSGDRSDYLSPGPVTQPSQLGHSSGSFAAFESKGVQHDGEGVRQVPGVSISGASCSH